MFQKMSIVFLKKINFYFDAFGVGKTGSRKDFCEIAVEISRRVWYNRRNERKGAKQMLRILVCDDDREFSKGLTQQIRQLLQKKGLQAQIYTCAAAEDIQPETMERYDIAFLDVDFAGKNYTGIDIARKLRSLRRDAVILFVTNFPEYAPEGYEVQAFRYLLKSAVSAKLESYLEQAVEQLEATEKTVTVNVYGESVRVPVKEILYVEAQLHEVQMCLAESGPLRFYASIGAMEELLESFGFLRIHKSYLVNMRYIQRLQCRQAELTGGQILPVSERNYAQLKKQYLLWKGI